MKIRRRKTKVLPFSMSKLDKQSQASRSSYAVEQKPLPAVMFYVVLHGSKCQLSSLVWKQQTASSVEKSVALGHNFRQV